MSLGAQMKDVVAQQRASAARAAQKSRSEAEEQKLKARLNAKFFFGYALALFTHRLTNGQLPGVICLGGKEFRDVARELEPYRWNIPVTASADWRTKGAGIWTPGHELHDVWEEFEAACTAADLAPQWTHQTDGFGNESWFELTVKPL